MVELKERILTGKGETVEVRAEFVYDERLGIPVPSLSREWDDYSAAEQASILLEWEAIRGTIPDRIYRLERIIIRKQDQLDREDDFAVSCRLNSEIAELASTITDLHIWYRVQQDRTDTKSHT